MGFFLWNIWVRSSYQRFEIIKQSDIDIKTRNVDKPVSIEENNYREGVDRSSDDYFPLLKSDVDSYLNGGYKKGIIIDQCCSSRTYIEKVSFHFKVKSWIEDTMPLSLKTLK